MASRLAGFYILLLVVPLFLCSLEVAAVKADEFNQLRYITDDALRACISDQLPHGREELTRLKCHSKGITDLAGLEHFTGIQELSLFNNAISEISPDLWPQLHHLNIAKNPIPRLTIYHPKLSKLYIFSSGLTELSLQTPNLEILKANNNGLVTIRLLETPKLASCDLYNNELKTMEIERLKACRHLDVRNNPMPDGLYEKMDAMECLVMHDGNAEDWQ